MKASIWAIWAPDMVFVDFYNKREITFRLSREKVREQGNWQRSIPDKDSMSCSRTREQSIYLLSTGFNPKPCGQKTYSLFHYNTEQREKKEKHKEENP